MVWYSHLLQNFPQFIEIHTAEGLGIVKELCNFYYRSRKHSHEKNEKWKIYDLIIFASIKYPQMLKILQARLQQYVSHELPDVQAGFRNVRGTTDQIPNIYWIIEKAREFQKKTSISALLTMPKYLTVWITINCGKF